MPDPRVDRRALLAALAGSTAALTGFTWTDAVAAWHDAQRQRARAATGTPPTFASLTPTEAADLEAMAECILPGGERPGAREAGVIHFMDQWFTKQGKGQLPDVRKGLALLATKVAKRHPGSRRFASLTEADQVALLTQVEKEAPAFFGGVRFLTLLGMFSDPGYGGNKGKAGWALVGFEDRYAWEAPFGAYDRE